MIQIISERAKKLIETPHFFVAHKDSKMRSYQGEQFSLWVYLECDEVGVNKFLFWGQLASWQQVIIESMASLIQGKKLHALETLSLRECEAYLRDKNSQLALEGLPDNAEKSFKHLFTWLRLWPSNVSSEDYQFPPSKGLFRNLSLVDKIKEMKAFLYSTQVLHLYGEKKKPELVDMVELEIYLNVPYSSEEDRLLLHDLHDLGVLMFNEDHLNFIPEP
jgi:hypothetical protein